LIDSKADVSLKDKAGKTALDYAIAKNKPQVISELLKGVKKPDEVFVGGLPVLHWAIRNSDSETVSLLLEKGAASNLQDALDRTPLHWAALNGDTEIVKLLIDSKADVSLKDSAGKTALNMLFTKYGNDTEALADILKVSKDPMAIANIIQHGAGYLWDDEKAWTIVKAIVDNIPKEQRVDILYDAVNLVGNASRKSKLINMLPEDEQASLRGKFNPIVHQKELSFVDLYGGVEPKMTKKQNFTQKEDIKKNNTRGSEPTR